MFTITANHVLPCTITGSWPRPRWFDDSLWGRPLDTGLMDVRFREKFQDALAVVLSDQERAGIDIVTNGDFHCDDDMAGRSWHHYPLQRWAGFSGNFLQSEATRSPWLRYPAGTLLNEIYTGWRWPRVTDKIEHRPLDYAKLWRMAQGRTSKPVKFGTCCSQVMGLFLDIHTAKYRDNREVIWDMAVAMNQELLALRDAGCKCIQIEEPTLHFWANTFGADHDNVKFMIEAYNREVQGLEDVELWIHTCWGNPNMQRVIENDSYRASFQLYLEACRGDVWTVEMKDRNLRETRPVRAAAGVAQEEDRHRRGEPSHAPGGAGGAGRRHHPRGAQAHRASEQLIISSDCGFGRQGCNRDIAFFKTSAIAQGTNVVRRELGLPVTDIRAANPGAANGHRASKSLTAESNPRCGRLGCPREGRPAPSSPRRYARPGGGSCEVSPRLNWASARLCGPSPRCRPLPRGIRSRR
jgi:5-methyltetrahydropteroyltriglutamate--homocysteine methyltransferase